jgi:apolipoprotein N-acyltransferase
MGLAFLTSVLLILALPPYDLWPLAWVALVPLLLAVSRSSAREAAAIGCFCGTSTNYLAFYWVLELMHQFSKLGPLAYLVMLAMAVYQSLPWALWCLLLRADGPAVVGPLRGAGALLLSALSWVALEFFHPIIFPWYLANSQHTRPEMTSVISLGGVSLLTLALVVVNLSLARLLVPWSGPQRAVLWPARLPQGGRGRSLLWLGVLLPPLLLVGYHQASKGAVEEAMAAAPRLAVGLVQPNEWINQAPSLNGLHDYQRLTEQLVRERAQQGLPLDLILWPESAVRTPPTSLLRQPAGAPASQMLSAEENMRSQALPRYPLDVTTIFPSPQPPASSLAEEQQVGPAELFAIQRGHDVPILFGTTMEDLDPDARGPLEGRAPLYNCAVLIDGAGQVLGAVKKVKLLMFGETIPGSAYYPDIYKLLPSASCLLPGPEPAVLELGQARLGIMICYEDLLPWFHYELAQKRPQILLNLTNDAWFGKTVEPICHLDLAALRAVEGRCYLIRSTPTGVSAVIDPFGRLVAHIPSDQAGTLAHEVELLDITTGFERFGDSVAWLSLLYLVGFGAFWWGGGRLHRRRPEAS